MGARKDRIRRGLRCHRAGETGCRLTASLERAWPRHMLAANSAASSRRSFRSHSFASASASTLGMEPDRHVPRAY